MPSLRINIQILGCILFVEFATNKINNYTEAMMHIIKFIDRAESYEGEPIAQGEAPQLPEPKVDGYYPFAASCYLRFESVKLLREFLKNTEEFKNLN